MRSPMSLVLTLALTVFASGSWARKPAPVECPADVTAALAALCPCSGMVAADQSITPWKNHGQYVRCMVHARNALRKGGCLAGDARRAIAGCAARSSCGKPQAPVTCCVTVTGTCSDPTAGDAIAAGTCSNDTTMVCDTAADCMVTTAQPTTDTAACSELGGAPAAGTMCNPCVAPAS